MINRNWFRAILFILLSVIGGYALAQYEPTPGKIDIKPREEWRSVFGGQYCAYYFQISADKEVSGRAGWSLRSGGRTIARGERAFEAGPAKEGLIKLQIDIPPVKEGVVIPVRFKVALYNIEELVSWEDTLYIFSRDPFVSKRDWLKKLDIGLFDPEKATQRVFEELKIPFQTQSNINALPEFKGSLLVIGSGLDFARHRNLWKLLINLSARQIPVLILAPGGGTIEFPGLQGVSLPKPEGIQLLRKEIIHRLDKKLDEVAWPPDGKIIASSMVLKQNRAGIIGEFVTGDEGWPWLELDFVKGKGKLVVCGFGIIDSMEAGPTPRFLLVRLFEYLIESK